MNEILFTQDVYDCQQVTTFFNSKRIVAKSYYDFEERNLRFNKLEIMLENGEIITVNKAIDAFVLADQIGLPSKGITE